jgi:hypothetical protein
MSTDRETTRIVRSWLEEGVTALPDRVLDNVLDQLPTTHQRRSWWQPRRVRDMNMAFRVALTAAAVVVVVIAGVGLLPRQPFVGPGVAVSPSVSPTATPSPIPLAEGSLAAGTYSVSPIEARQDISVIFDVPSGWEGYAGGGWALGPTPPGLGAPNGLGMAFLAPDALFNDPCHWDTEGTGAWPRPGNVHVGPTAADLSQALKSIAVQAGAPGPSVGATNLYTATEQPDVEVGGFRAKRMTLQLPTADKLDLSTCDNGTGNTDGAYFVFGPAGSGGTDLFAQGPGQIFHLWIVDVDGSRIVIIVNDYGDTSRQLFPQAQAIVNSIRIQN